MKQIYTIIAILFITFSAVAQSRPVITFSVATGDWSDASSWNLNRIPTDGDSIVIPQNKTVLFDKKDTLANVYIKVIGTFIIKQKLRLSASSVIELAATGNLRTWNVNRSNEIISIGGVIKYDQNAAASILGIAFAASNTGISPNGFSVSILPVVFNGFYAIRNNNNVVLNWSTAMEHNNKNFEVQRSFDGSTWTVIASLAGAGNSDNIQQYSYTDKNMTTAVAYYRIRQVDINGGYEYSIVKTVRANEAAPATKIYANGNTVNVEFNQDLKNTVTVRVIDMNGRVIGQKDNQQASYRMTINISNHITGMYLVQLNNNAGWNEVKKVML
ncbi:MULTISPECIES: T9SS type A sorting domain-containing protein [Niastella]|uniref:T9SS type A sorting domain-containing protein n=1 Tax=Niastella soli TaxID=2821487 RepID=A0ABS3YWY0_9BACT|nr:T9SS type A sorting domain-containing protein [Niastella soli]MBO9202344.1 T9SS type A sorting domain-containing protein [Niastella soli]